MVKVFIAPRRYVQGAGVLNDIGKYVAPLGKRVLVAWGPVVSEQFNAIVKKSFEECKSFSHGEKVSFGVATQLCLDEDIDPDERLAVFDFMVDVGLPVTLQDLGLGDISTDALKSFAEVLCGPDQITHNHVFTVTPFDMYSAMVAADKLGRSCKDLVE